MSTLYVAVVPLPECAEGEEAWPTETGYVCGPADLAIPDAAPVLTVEVAVVPPIAPHLAETGADMGLAMWAVGLVLIGATLKAFAKATS